MPIKPTTVSSVEDNLNEDEEEEFRTPFRIVSSKSNIVKRPQNGVKRLDKDNSNPVRNRGQISGKIFVCIPKLFQN